MYVFLFVSYILTNHAGSQRPTMANEGQHRSIKAHSSQRRPTKANGVCFFHFLFFILITTRQCPPHPSLANTSRGWVYSPPPTTHHHHHHHLTTSSTTSSQRRPPKANAGPLKPTAANDGQQRPTQVNEGQRRPMKANAGP